MSDQWKSKGEMIELQINETTYQFNLHATHEEDEYYWTVAIHPNVKFQTMEESIHFAKTWLTTTTSQSPDCGTIPSGTLTSI